MVFRFAAASEGRRPHDAVRAQHEGVSQTVGMALYGHRLRKIGQDLGAERSAIGTREQINVSSAAAAVDNESSWEAAREASRSTIPMHFPITGLHDAEVALCVK